MNDNQREFTLTAIGLLTAWHEDPDDVTFGFQQLEHLKRDGGPEAVEQALVGMANVAGSLLKSTAQASQPKRTEQEILQELTRLFAAG